MSVTAVAAADISDKTAQRLMALLAVGLFALYAFTAAREVDWRDSIHFTVSCLNGDIAHSPGYPLYAILCQPFAAIPGIPPPWAAALFSATTAVAACIALFHIVRLLGGDRIAALAAAALFGVSRSFWGQANIPEVYTLNVLIFLLVLLILLHWRQRPTLGKWLALIFTGGLGLTNHWPLFTLAAFALPILCWRQRGWLAAQLRRPIFIPATVTMLAAGLSPYLYLIWRAQNPVAFMFLPFAPQDWTSFRQIVSRELFATIDQQSGVGVSDKIKFAAFLTQQLLLKELGLPGGVLILIGAIRRWRRDAIDVSLTLTLIFLGATAGLIFLLNFLYSPAHEQTFIPYPLIPYAVACIWAASAVPPVAWRIPLFVAVFIFAVVTNFTVNDRRQPPLSSDIVNIYLETLPAGAFFPALPFFKLLKYTQYMDSHRSDIILLPPPHPYLMETVYPGERLYPPSTLSYAEELDRVNAYIRDHPACYNSFIEFSSNKVSQEYLLFSCLRQPGAPAAVINPAISDFLRRLAAAYSQLSSWGDRQIGGRILQNAVYSMLYLRSNQRLPMEWKTLLEELSATAPGQLTALEYLLRQPGLTLSRRRADAIEATLTENLPQLSRRQQARLLSAVGNIYAAVSPRSDATLAAAKAFHRQAVERYAAAHSPGAQAALAFYRRENLPAEEAALTARFGAALLNVDKRLLEE